METIKWRPQAALNPFVFALHPHGFHSFPDLTAYADVDKYNPEHLHLIDPSAQCSPECAKKTHKMFAKQVIQSLKHERLPSLRNLRAKNTMLRTILPTLVRDLYEEPDIFNLTLAKKLGYNQKKDLDTLTLLCTVLSKLDANSSCHPSCVLQPLQFVLDMTHVDYTLQDLAVLEDSDHNIIDLPFVRSCIEESLGYPRVIVVVGVDPLDQNDKTSHQVIFIRNDNMVISCDTTENPTYADTSKASTPINKLIRACALKKHLKFVLAPDTSNFVCESSPCVNISVDFAIRYILSNSHWDAKKTVPVAIGAPLFMLSRNFLIGLGKGKYLSVYKHLFGPEEPDLLSYHMFTWKMLKNSDLSDRTLERKLAYVLVNKPRFRDVVAMDAKKDFLYRSDCYLTFDPQFPSRLIRNMDIVYLVSMREFYAQLLRNGKMTIIPENSKGISSSRRS